MESIYTELALYGTKDECVRTDNVFSPISEVCDGTVSLWETAIHYSHIYYLQSDFCPNKIHLQCIKGAFQ